MAARAGQSLIEPGKDMILPSQGLCPWALSVLEEGLGEEKVGKGETSGGSGKHRAPEGVCPLPASVATSQWTTVLGIM